MKNKWYYLFGMVTGGILLNGAMLDILNYNYTIESTICLFISGAIVGLIVAYLNNNE